MISSLLHWFFVFAQTIVLSAGNIIDVSSEEVSTLLMSCSGKGKIFSVHCNRMRL